MLYTQSGCTTRAALLRFMFLEKMFCNLTCQESASVYNAKRTEIITVKHLVLNTKSYGLARCLFTAFVP